MPGRVTINQHRFIVVFRKNYTERLNMGQVDFHLCNDANSVMMFIGSENAHNIKNVFAINENGETEEHELIVEGFKTKLVPKK